MIDIYPALKEQKVGILYQALAPPIIDGARKDPKPGGYSDSGADIGFSLRRAGLNIVTPSIIPDPAIAIDWVFPDTSAGIAKALDRGVTLFWANTVLFSGHPIEDVMNDCWIVGQMPSAAQAGDDKFVTNARLREHGLPVATSVLAASQEENAISAINSLTVEELAYVGLSFPLIVKPLRGRGSQGVTLVEDFSAFKQAATALIASGRFGKKLIVEEYLDGVEMTVTIMPRRRPGRHTGKPDGPWALPPVRRFNHEHGVTPYNGAVAVKKNSQVLSIEEAAASELQVLLNACITAAQLIDARAPIRIDCRADENGVYRLFDLNMKPNMTGAGRPGRED
jgi:D-alanine-D-alanine ligase-like ATP-grasp enzyme